jgi:chaperone modulatory protein CbpM
MKPEILNGILFDEQTEISLNDLSHVCRSSTEWIVELVEEGVLEPLDYQQTQWSFSGNCLQRAHTAMRLQRDLDINLAGVALALDLLDEINTLEARLRCVEMNDGK